MIAMVNKILNRTEITIFLIFLLLYSIFIQWNGWDENSRFFLTQAIVDEGRLEIDSFANQTSDRAVVQNHYYSDKDPGASFFATIPYSIFKLVFHDAVSTDTVAMYLTNHVGNSKIYDILNPDWFTLYSMIAVVIFTSVLFSALTLVLIYKITGLFTDERNKRLLVTISAGLATTIFPYALVFTDNAIAGFFSLLGFYLLLKKKFQNLEAKKQKNYSFFSGIAFGLSILASIFGVIISGIAFLYLLKMKNKNRYLKLFIIGFSLILLVYLSYNFLIFKNPLAWRYNYLDTNVFIYSKRDPSALWRFFVPNIYIVWRLLIDPYKGLFFYFPILLLSLYGLYKMSKLRMGAEVALISLIFVFNVILNSSSATGAWWGGGGFFGPRHLTYSVPFLTVALVFSFNSSSYRSVSYLLFIVLVVYSTVVNFAGIRVPFPEITAADKLTLDPQYVARVNSFEVLVNPIFDYYLPEFFKTGPVSRILETSFSCDNKIDIRQPLPIHQQNCTKPMIAEIETPIAANQSIKLCVCSQYGGGDGTIVNFEIDNTKNYIHIDSNKCKTEILEVPFTTNVTHKIKIEPGIYGVCDREGMIIREIDLIDKTNDEKKTLPLAHFDFASSFEIWNSTGNIVHTGNGTVLGVGNCDDKSSLQKTIIIPKGAKEMSLKMCADFAGGDGTIMKVFVDTDLHTFEISSNLCQEANFSITKFADGKEHLIRIESKIKRNCYMEGPAVSWLKIN